jgi:hypothetical protein
MTAAFDDDGTCDDLDTEVHIDFPVLPPSEAGIPAGVHIAPHHGYSFSFVLQDFGHLVRPPALVALSFGFHPVGAPGPSTANSNCLAV